MTKLQDRLNQNPVKQPSTEKQTVSKMQLSSNLKSNQGDKVRSPHDDLDDSDQDHVTVPDENTNVVNPKSQLHNSLAQRAQRNQQLD